MEHSQTLQDLCREEKERQSKTAKGIADRQELPLDTVGSFFSRPSKAPSVYTVGPICADLGISLNEYFGISEKDAKPMPEELAAEVERRHAVELRCAHLEGEVATLRALNRISRRNSAVMFALSTLVILYLLCRLLVFDASVPTAGLVLNGQATAGVWVLIAFVLIAVVVMGVMLLRIVRHSGESNEPMPDLPVRTDLLKR